MPVKTLYSETDTHLQRLQFSIPHTRNRNVQQIRHCELTALLLPMWPFDCQSITVLLSHPVCNTRRVNGAYLLKSAIQILRGKQIKMPATDILVDGDLAVVAAARMF